MDDLEVRVQELEKENEYLKSLLDQAGIIHDFQTYLKRMEIAVDPEAADKAPKSDVVAGTGDQGARIRPCKISTKHAQYFFLFFRGREDVYALRAVNKKTGRAGYYPQCHNFWRRGVCPKSDRQKVQCKDCENRAWIKLKSDQIEAHLRGDRQDGSDVIGIYPLFPDGTCRFLVFDFDNHGNGAETKDGANEDGRWVEVNALQEICRRNDVPFLTERSRSGRGAHVWIYLPG